MSYQNTIIIIERTCNRIPEKYHREFRFDELKRLLLFLEKENIVDDQILILVNEISQELSNMDVKPKLINGNYGKKYLELKQYLRREYGITEKEYYKNKYALLGLFILGIPLFAFLLTINPILSFAYLSSICMMGVSYGILKDRKAMEKCKAY